MGKSIYFLCCVIGAQFFLAPFVYGNTVVADYNNEVRLLNGRVDVPTLVRRLQELKVNTYFYLIWHAETDWDDLKLFLPAAQEAEIDVWVYLVPPSESPPFTSIYSEPFRLDYVRWAREIAHLSLTFPNLKAFVIDDFWANRTFFTPQYVATMTTEAQQVNTKLQFWPLMYYREIDRLFVQSYGALIDGVVAAYPKDEAVIQQAWRWLQDEQDEPAAWTFTYPGRTRSSVGDFAAVQKKFVVEQSVRQQITLMHQDSYEGPTENYHFSQVLIDDVVVWENDVAGGARIWQDVVLDVTEHVQGKETVVVTMRVYDKKPVSNFEVTVLFQEPQFEGLGAQGLWTTSHQGAWEVVFKDALAGERQFHIPLVVMVAAQRAQFIKRWGEPASPERMRDKLKMALVTMRHGFANGVVTYALYKEPGDAVYHALRRLFLKASTSATSDFDDNGRVDFADFLVFTQAYGLQVGENATLKGELDLDLDGAIGFGDFLLFVKDYQSANP